MNWKLILQLSMFGLAMGLATVFFIPSNIEPFCWLVIFAVCAYIIARQCRTGRFLHGLLLGVANSVWITAAHVLLFSQYIANHAREVEMMKSAPMPPRIMMLVTGPVIGIISGAVIGLFALLAGKLVKPAPAAYR
jgi:hypothetical protein